MYMISRPTSGTISVLFLDFNEKYSSLLTILRLSLLEEL
jgi:hypothetical protein